MIDQAGRESRRAFLRKMSLAVPAAGTAFAGGCSSINPLTRRSRRPPTVDEQATVTMVTGNERRQMMRDVLQPHKEYLANTIGNRQVIIKVNFVGTGQVPCTTHPDAVRGVMDVLNEFYDRPVIVGESKGFTPSFEHYGYFPLRDEYDNLVIREMHEGEWGWHYILDENLFLQPIRVVNAYMDPDNYIISLTRIKTHNCVVATLSLKNVVMGTPIKLPARNINDKSKMHAGNKTPKQIHYNLFEVAKYAHPHFSILDGYEGLEGDGPINGHIVDHRVALAGSDFVAVDHIGAELMAVPFENLGYLNYCADWGLGQGDRDKITVTGENPAHHIIEYQLHSNIDWQLQWDDEIEIQPV